MDVTSIALGTEGMDEHTPDWLRSLSVKFADEVNRFVRESSETGLYSADAVAVVKYLVRSAVASYPLQQPVPIGFDRGAALEGIRAFGDLVRPLAALLEAAGHELEQQLASHGWGSIDVASERRATG